MVKAQLEIHGTPSPRQVLNFEADEQTQELAVWLQEKGSNTVVSFGLQVPGHWGFSSGGVGLELFLPGHPVPDAAPPGSTPSDFINAYDLSPALTRRIQDWLEQQAITRLQKEHHQ